MKCRGDVEQLRRLIDNKVDPNLGEHDGRTALHQVLLMALNRFLFSQLVFGRRQQPVGISNVLNFLSPAVAISIFVTGTILFSIFCNS